MQSPSTQLLTIFVLFYGKFDINASMRQNNNNLYGAIKNQNMRHEQTLRDDSYSTKESYTKKKDLILIWGMGLEKIS